jgi:hypothetical protein
MLPVDEIEPEYLAFVNGKWREEGLGREVDFGGGGRDERKGTVTRGENEGHREDGDAGEETGEGEREEEDDRALYAETVRVAENPLTVTEEDALKKRYKAYRKWLRGKSLFKQQPVD